MVNSDIKRQPGTAVVTGATGGVGLEIAKGLARVGYHIVIGARGAKRGEDAATAVRAVARSRDAVEVKRLDLASLSSVAEFASGLSDEPIDRLVLNAGLLVTSRKETEDGFEMMFGTNVLGHFALVLHLLDRVEAADEPRVITQSSESHRRGRINLEDPQHVQGFSAFGTYNDSKQAEHILAVELDRRHPRAGSVVCQPGWVKSDLGRDVTGIVQRAEYFLGNLLVGQTPAEGAQSALEAALRDEVPGAATGFYITPGRFRHLRGKPVVASVSPRVMDPETGRDLWNYALSVTSDRKS